MVQRYDVGPRLSEMAVHNGTVYLAGQVPTDATADMTGQTQQVLDQIDALLERAHTDRSRLLMVQIFIADLADFADMNAVYEKWLAGVDAPPRATVQAALANPAWKVEMVVTAAL